MTQPINADQILQRAIEHHRAGGFDAAIAGYRQVLGLHPNHAAVLNLLGVACTNAGRFDEAIEAFEQCLQQMPHAPEVLSNLALAYREAGKIDDAIGAMRLILQHHPGDPEIHQNIVMLLGEARRFDEAIELLEQSLQANPNSADAFNSIGILHDQAGRADEAIEAYEKAIALRPDLPSPQGNLGNARVHQGFIDEAIAAYRKTMELAPSLPMAHSNLLMTMNYHPRLEPREVFEEHLNFAERFEKPLLSRAKSHAHVDRNPDRPLRIGFHTQYASGDPMVSFMEGMLAARDRRNFTYVAYTNHSRFDEVGKRLHAYHDLVRPIGDLSDEQAADLIHRDGIDILVDLSGHIGGNRLGMFPYKPAPIALTYLGYANTTGLKSIDYLITDEVTDPLDAESLYVEKLIRLSGGFCCYTPRPDAPAVAPLPSIQSGYITFGSLHPLAKINADVLALWARVLDAVPNSRLLIYRHTLVVAARERIAREIASHGIDASRVELRHDYTHGGHLTTYHEIDIALDCFPWSGHTTACEGLWMGVPIVSLRGRTHAGRMVASVLTQLQLADLVADSPQQYVSIAASLAADIEKLRELRAELRPRMAGSRLCNGPRLAREIEAVFRQIWVAWTHANP